MSGKNTAVFGIYKNTSQADQAVDRILAAGFSNNDISVLLPDARALRSLRTRRTPRLPKALR